MEKSKKFTKKEYTWATNSEGKKAKFTTMNDDSAHNDRGNDMKQTTIPKREKEEMAICEFVSKMNIDEEISGRKYSRTIMIGIIESIETELENEEDAQKRRKRERER